MKWKCEYCDYTDELYNKYLSATKDYEKELYWNIIYDRTVNGYELLKVLERNGYINNKQNIENVKNYVSDKYPTDEEKETIKQFNSNIDFDTNLIESRWCRFCGQLKNYKK